MDDNKNKGFTDREGQFNQEAAGKLDLTFGDPEEKEGDE